MANDQFMTPGSAVADQLQTLLANKRAERQQRLVDSLNVVNSQSNLEDHALQVKSQADERAAKVADLQAREADRNKLIQGLSAFDPSKLDPEDQQMFKLVQSTGNPDLLKTLITGSMNRERKPQGGDVLTVDKDGNVVDSGVYADYGQHVQQLPQPPQANAANVQQIYKRFVPDPNHPGQKVEETHWLFPGQKPSAATLIDGDMYKGNPPQTKAEAGPTAADRANIAKLKKTAVDKPGFFGFGGSKAKPGDVAAFNQAVDTYIGKYPTSQDVRDTVRDVINHEDPSTPVADIVAAHKDAFQTPAELDQFNELLSEVRGNKPAN